MVIVVRIISAFHIPLPHRKPDEDAALMVLIVTTGNEQTSYGDAMIHVITVALTTMHLVLTLIEDSMSRIVSLTIVFLPRGRAHTLPLVHIDFGYP